MTQQIATTETGPTTPTEPAVEVPAAEVPTADAPTTTDDDNGDGPDPESGNAEAAKYRRRLRDAEAERDGLAAKLDAAEQSVVAWALGQAGLDPRLWALSEVDLDPLRNEGGHLDPAAIINRAKEIRSQVFGGPLPNPQQGQPSGTPLTTLETVFDPNRRR